jgi:6,7-dimethyl-8-ribityllumazine synthase
MHKFQGDLMGKGLHVAIVASRFNETITSSLVEGAKDCLLRHGVEIEGVNEYWVPGAFELPLVADKLLGKGYFDAVIVLGAVIRGETPHFDQVVAGVTSGIASTTLKHGKPVIYGVLTTDTVEQAMNRSGLKAGNKGWEAALSALEMANLLKKI